MCYIAIEMHYMRENLVSFEINMNITTPNRLYAIDPKRARITLVARRYGDGSKTGAALRGAWSTK